MNLGWPFAYQLIGIGAASAIMALGPVSVGLLDDIRARHWKPIWLRAGVLVGIVGVTEPWNGAQFSIWGVLGAACAAWHFWNIPKCLSAFGDDDAKKDRGMLLSNLRAMPVIALVAIVVSALAGWSWVAGDVTLGSVLATVGKGVFAALFVMVVPILLINRAAKHMKPSTQGVMFAFSPIVSGIVGFIGAHFGLMSENQDISVVNAIGILMVSGFAFMVIRVREGAKATAEVTTEATAGHAAVRLDDGQEHPLGSARSDLRAAVGSARRLEEPVAASCGRTPHGAALGATPSTRGATPSRAPTTAGSAWPPRPGWSSPPGASRSATDAASPTGTTRSRSRSRTSPGGRSATGASSVVTGSASSPSSAVRAC
ncbi:hypothetical protein ACFQY7_49870 [Actinomadura luteofluorescens]|uniref:hypothetical protein n=1 Tax=Actinomadura luteofluorescens TaxID=46163 RepID=UPI003639BA06